MAYPSMDRLLLAWLPGVLSPPPTRIGEDPPTRLAAGMREVIVGEIPGPGDAQITLDVADVVIDCYASDRDAARDLGELVRSALRLLLPATTHGDAFIKQVQTLAKPALIPYDVAVIRKSSATYRITTHATP